MVDKETASAKTSLDAGKAGALGEKKPKIEEGKNIGGNEVDLAKGRDAVQERLDKLSKANEEGNEKNLKAIEEAHKPKDGDEERTADEDGRVSGAAPHLGREDNGNTPVVGKDGSKSWHPPGVAGK